MILLKKLKRWQAGLIAIFISFAIAFTTYTAQTRVTETVPDAQGGIVTVYSLIINVVLWLFYRLRFFILCEHSRKGIGLNPLSPPH